MATEYTNVSYMGSRDDVLALSKLAALLGMKIGELVRNAVDATYGDQLQQMQVFSSALSGQQNHRLMNTLSDKVITRNKE